MMKKREKKPKKIVFSEEIDSIISGYALAIAFVGIGLFLLFEKNYFGNQIVASVVRWIFIVIGSLGLLSEMSKTFEASGLKGFGDFMVGFIFMTIWFVCYYSCSFVWLRVIAFLILVIGSFGFFRGIIEIIYSIRIGVKENKAKKSNTLSSILLLLTQVFGLVVVFVQLLKQLQ